MKTIRLMTLLVVVLFTTLANAQTKETLASTVNLQKLLSDNEEITKAIADIAELFKNKTAIFGPENNGEWLFWGTQKNITVLKDRMELKRKGENIIIYFTDLYDHKISFTKIGEDYGCTDFGNFRFEIGVKGETKKLADDVMLIHNQLNENIYKLQLLIFEPIAAQYRSLKVKPLVSEAQRKYIVQANVLNQQKMYTDAIELYNKAIELDQTAYPAAYSNLALISAQLRNFYAAIYYMKKYLLLETEASDARSCQDKIYEWEIIMKK